MVENTTYPKKNKEYFTETARAAAAEARRRKRELKKDTDELHVFVSRCTNNEKRFVFEIRQYGGVIVHRSDQNFTNFKEAQEAGKRCLKLREMRNN